MAARIFAHVSSYPVRPKPPLDPTLTDANLRQRGALFGALEERDRTMARGGSQAAAALLDVLWSVATYERLVSDWDMDPDQAIRTVTWAIGLVEEAVSAGPPTGQDADARAACLSDLGSALAPVAPALARLAGAKLLDHLVRALDVEFVPARPQLGEQIDELARCRSDRPILLVDGRVQILRRVRRHPRPRGVITASVVRASEGWGTRRTSFSSSSRSMMFVTVAGGMRSVLLIQLRVRADSGSVASQARTS